MEQLCRWSSQTVANLLHVHTPVSTKHHLRPLRVETHVPPEGALSVQHESFRLSLRVQILPERHAFVVENQPHLCLHVPRQDAKTCARNTRSPQRSAYDVHSGSKEREGQRRRKNQLELYTPSVGGIILQVGERICTTWGDSL